MSTDSPDEPDLWDMGANDKTKENNVGELSEKDKGNPNTRKNK